MAEDRQALLAAIEEEETRLRLLAQIEEEEKRLSQKTVPHGTQPTQQDNVPHGTEDDERAQLLAAIAEEENKQGIPSAPSEEDDPGFFSNLKKGSAHGKEDLVRQATIFNQLLSGEVPEPIPVPQSEELGLSRKAIGQFGGRMITGGAPSMVGGIAGAKIGASAGALGGPIGATVGGIAGGITGSAPIATAQAYADAYNEARLSGQDHEKALEHAGTIAKISGGVNTIAGALGAVGLKDAFLKHALKQIPIQTAASNVENIARNVAAKEAGVDPERDILAGTKEATFGPGALHVAQAAGTKAVIGAKNIVKGKAENVPHGTSAPSTEPPPPPGGSSPEANVPRGTTEKPRFKFDEKTQSWVEQKVNVPHGTNETSVIKSEKLLTRSGETFVREVHSSSIDKAINNTKAKIKQTDEAMKVANITPDELQTLQRRQKGFEEHLQMLQAKKATVGENALHMENVPRGTEKPRVKYDPETQKWVAAKKATGEKSTTVTPAEETNLSSKKGVTEEQKVAADVDLHKKMFGERQEVKEPSFIKKWYDKSMNFIKSEFSEAGAFNSLAPIKKYGKTETAGENKAFRLASFAKNASGSVKAGLQHGRYYWDKAANVLRVNTKAPGLMPIVKMAVKNPQMAKDFEVYAASRRIKSQKLIEQGKEQNYTHADVEKGLALQDKHPHFEQAFDELMEYNKALIDVGIDTGVIPKAVGEKWKETDYVPFPRELGIEEGVPFKSGANKLAGQKLHVKPLEGKTKKWRVMDGDKEVGRFNSAEAAEDYAHDHSLTAEEGHVGHVTKNIFESLFDNVGKMVPTFIKNKAALDTIKAAQLEGAAIPISKKASTNIKGERHKDVVSVLEDGKQRFYQVTDEPLFKALTTTLNGSPQYPAVLKPLRFAKQAFSMITVTNPSTAMYIASKDILQSQLVGKYSMNGITGIVKDLPLALGRSVAHEFGWRKDPALIELAAMGAESRFANVTTKSQMKELNNYISDKKIALIPMNIIRSPKKLLDWTQSLINGVEGANRIRKYEAAKKAGKDIGTAGFESLDYMDYGKRGSGHIARIITDFVPFAGTHLSSSHTVATELGHKYGMNRTVGRLAGLAAFSGYNAIVNNDEKNDPDPATGYSSLPAWMKDNNIVIDTYRFPSGVGKERLENNDPRWILIPKPWEVGQLGATVPEKLVGLVKGEEDGESVLKYLGNVFTEYLTLNPFGHPFLKTYIEERANKKYFLDMPIVPRQTEELAPFLQYGPKTTEAAKKLGEKFDMSPARIEHMGNGVLGALSDFLFMAGDVIINDQSSGEKPEKPTSDKYIFNKFIKGTLLEHTSYESEVYDMYHKTKEAAKTLKQLDKITETDADAEKADKYAEKNEDLIDKASYADEMRKMVKDYNDQIAQIRKDKDLSGREKKAAIDDVIREKTEALYEFHQEIKAEKRANKKGK